jgi:hypothetical protein
MLLIEESVSYCSNFISYSNQLKPHSNIRYLRSSYLRKQNFEPFSTRNEADIDSNSFWKENVEYFDLNFQNTEISATSRSLPLFLLGGAFFPQGTTFLNVFEMKYRTMMFDVANSDDMFGYIHTNSRTGQIASVGTLCKVNNNL